MISIPKLRIQKPVIKGLGRLIGNSLFAVLVLLILVSVFFNIQSRALGKPPAFFGHQLYTVMSGSMEPNIHTGSIIFVKPEMPEELAVNDIITFKSSETQGELITHRIVQVHHDGSLRFTTKGDANRANDPASVPSDYVVGKVRFIIPVIGYLIHFAQTKNGILFLIILPGTLLLAAEVRQLIRYAILMDRQKQSKGGVSMD